jgi:hypothetical protein
LDTQDSNFNAISSRKNFAHTKAHTSTLEEDEAVALNTRYDA